MATGTEMLVNAVLKAAGYERKQLDDGLAKGKAMVDDFERRLAGVEYNVNEIRTMVQAIADAVAPKPIQELAHDADVDATSN